MIRYTIASDGRRRLGPTAILHRREAGHNEEGRIPLPSFQAFISVDQELPNCQLRRLDDDAAKYIKKERNTRPTTSETQQ